MLHARMAARINEDSTLQPCEEKFLMGTGKIDDALRLAGEQKRYRLTQSTRFVGNI